MSGETGPSRTDGGVAWLGLAAGRLCGVASARGTRVCSGVQGLIANFLQGASCDGLSPLAEAAEKRAERIARILRERAVIPNRIGIDGLPGSGKSTLARALAPKFGLRWISLDYKDLGGSQEIQQDRIIVEHHRLFRTQDIDVFDAIIYNAESPERARAKTVRRGRGAILAAILDYDKLKRVGDLAFDACNGEPIVLGKGDLILKIRPQGGFRVVENIGHRLRQAGLDAAGLSKEEGLFLLAFGKREEGFSAYCSPYTFFAGLGGLAGWLTSRTGPSPTTDPPVSE